MKVILFFLVSFLFLNSFALSQITDEAKHIKVDLVKQLKEKSIKFPVKLAVLDFESKTESLKKIDAGSVFSQRLLEEFIKDSNFIVVERKRL